MTLAHISFFACYCAEIEIHLPHLSSLLAHWREQYRLRKGRSSVWKGAGPFTIGGHLDRSALGVLSYFGMGHSSWKGPRQG